RLWFRNASCPSAFSLLVAIIPVAVCTADRLAREFKNIPEIPVQTGISNRNGMDPRLRGGFGNLDEM
ncbi:MAG: hypothetical protein ACE5FM_09880, partial [Methyloligellaceae bacterium]